MKKEIFILDEKPITSEERQRIMNKIFSDCLQVAKRYFSNEERAQDITFAFCTIVNMEIPWNKEHKELKKFFGLKQ